jgi:peptidoglycan/xylan/chitin deacetylase (PgdA/CDA1 family)
MNKLNFPVFTISLDFELMWGVFEKKDIKKYGKNIKGGNVAILKILELFNDYNIHATWAVVGMLYYDNLKKLVNDIPKNIPDYKDPNLSSYNHINTLNNRLYLEYYSAKNLIKQIKKTKFQEIATHTFSHFYCLEKNFNLNSFNEDINLAIKKAKDEGIEVKSIIFPRNQYNQEVLIKCYQNGINAFRGNEKNFLQKPRNQNKLNLFIRIIRYLDSYFNITGFNIYDTIEKTSSKLFDIPASYFFRPYGRITFLEKLKIIRIKKAMLSAAKNNKLFHIWWHPHNFGSNIENNILQLKEVLEYYIFLNKKYGMKSLNMNDLLSKFQ